MFKTYKKEILLIIAVIILVAVGGVYLLIHNSHNKDDLHYGDLELIEGKYKDAYFLTNEYEDEVFVVIADYEELDKAHKVKSQLASSGYDALTYENIYDPKIPINTYLEVTLPYDQYVDLVDEYAMYKMTTTMTTVVVPVEVTEDDVYAYCFIYATEMPVEQQITKSLNLVNSNDECLVVHESPIKDKKTLDKYLERFEKN